MKIVKLAVGISLFALSSSVFAWSLYKDKGDIKLIKCNSGTTVFVSQSLDKPGKWVKGRGGLFSTYFDTWQEAADSECSGRGG